MVSVQYFLLGYMKDSLYFTMIICLLIVEEPEDHCVIVHDWQDCLDSDLVTRNPTGCLQFIKAP